MADTGRVDGMKDAFEEKYRDALARGRPKHGSDDSFSLRHPRMPLAQRAKIFAPFDALAGFGEQIEAKLERYVEKRELNEAEQAALDRALSALYDKTRSRQARETPVIAAVTYYLPCQDEQHEAYGRLGSYERVTGRVVRLDPVLTRTLQIGELRIAFSDIARIEILNTEEEDT